MLCCIEPLARWSCAGLHGADNERIALRVYAVRRIVAWRSVDQVVARHRWGFHVPEMLMVNVMDWVGWGIIVSIVGFGAWVVFILARTHQR